MTYRQHAGIRPDSPASPRPSSLLALVLPVLITACGDIPRKWDASTLAEAFVSGCSPGSGTADKEYTIRIPYTENDAGVWCPGELAGNQQCVTLQRRPDGGGPPLNQKIRWQAIGPDGEVRDEANFLIWFNPFKKGAISSQPNSGQTQKIKLDTADLPPAAVFKYTIYDTDNDTCPAIDPRIRVH